MPRQNDRYVAPSWKNDQPPAIDAEELGAISQSLEEAPKVLFGSGPPTSGLGKNGDLYVDIS